VKLRFAHLAVIGALAAAFALAGCGRKGPLDPPPGAASTTSEKKQGSQQKNAVNPIGSRENTEDSGGFDADGRPVAPANAPKKRLPMDWLLD